MLSSELISSIIPTPNLSDINAGELENDISIIINWIKLFPQPIAEPTLRVKSAVKSVLKDESSQFQFTKLLNNSINENFQLEGFHMDGMNICPDELQGADLATVISRVINTKRFYDNLLISLNLNLSTSCLNLYKKNINKNFKLLIGEEVFLAKIYTYFDENFLRLNSFHDFNIILMLQFFEAIEMKNELNQILINILIKKIKFYINENFKLAWSVPILHTLNNFIEHQIYSNIDFVLKSLHLSIDMNDLIKIGYNELISLRINEIYSIIIDYPKSEISLVELNRCLNFQNSDNFDPNIEFYQRNKLVENFSDNVNKNLLNAGINTINLIKTYIKIIKSFLILDPKGVLLDKVIRPVRKYLKTRDDIINKLVLGLLNKEPELVELSRELQNTEKSFKLFKNFDELNDLNWVPDPIDALPDFKKFKINDIIQSLISIFDSKEIFIVEFTKLFGNKMINSEEDLSVILKMINLLKLRFGKNEFFNLDIMVKDFINSRSNRGMVDSTNLNCLILSHLYWSDIIETPSFTLHPSLLLTFQAYNEMYKRENFNRFLKIIPNFGTVKLSLEGKSYNVPLDKASVILMFHDNNEPVSVASISETLNMSEYFTNKILEFWVSEGILLKITPQLYASNE
ncbi:hypothetical protein PSN45_000589 [Yamadazyma tenuis]|uniref:Cullin family profile domain-containing protein n=1 Tax=Candida tenuis (strain ATCC 10573 / BCRC 21748 / CBS 615 / JCM 9827 / NBRC 10315 / NRRL Y-1498 / VKM Y-70) TaxID=590646 RepID=G3B9I4_CANTC|nr:uncharacterized protein CANTEDRAFT_99018 [Yamadazyma tenuis ATCC 10573]EGV61895.1 hypothetical protein CANTEDRAFT_99018 [Yamadazyma tenuis ATCC 10573]WEJ93128.1 hypothetical protein PSN45_000589 [Yamadazyma tenuis]